jgi:hypothetical protein
MTDNTYYPAAMGSLFPFAVVKFFTPPSKNRAKSGLKSIFFQKNYFLLFLAGGFGPRTGCGFRRTAGAGNEAG